MFQIGDYVVCPGHGVGQVLSLEKKEIGEEVKAFYTVKVVSNGMKVLIPSDSKEGLRSLVTDNEVKEVYSLLENHNVEIDNSTWNRRHREYLFKVKTGSLLEIADVLRSLLLLKISKKLSFGERKMLDQCRDLLVKEIALSSGDAEEKIGTKIDTIFEAETQENITSA